MIIIKGDGIMLSFIRSNKGNIIVGIISALIMLVFVQPLFNLLTNFGQKTGITLINIFTDSVYAFASDINAYTFPFILFSIMIGLTTGFTIAIVSKGLFTKRTNSQVSQNAQIVKNKNRIRELKIILVVLTIILDFLLLSFFDIPFVIASTYTRNITIVTPYTDYKTIEMLNSKWVRIKNKNDYINVINQIKSIAARSGIEKYIE